MPEQSGNVVQLPPAEADTSGKAPPKGKGKKKPNRPLPSDRMGFPRQLDTLRGFAVGSDSGSKPVGKGGVASLLKMNATTVGFMLPFFVDSSFITRAEGGGYIPSTEVIAFNLAHQWNPEAAAQKLAPIISRTWFALDLLPRVEFSAMEEQEAIESLSMAAGAGPEYRPQLRLLLDYLEAAGLIRREGSLIRRGAAQGSTEPAPAPASPVASAVAEKGKEVRPAVTTAFSKEDAEGLLHFTVNVRVRLAEVGTWSPDRIERFFHGIAECLSAKAGMEEQEADTT